MDYCTKKAALFFVACDANPDTRVKIPNAMRIKGYSPNEAADRSLQQQVRREADKIKGEAREGKGEGELSHDCRGYCAGRGGVQGTGLSCNNE